MQSRATRTHPGVRSTGAVIASQPRSAPAGFTHSTGSASSRGLLDALHAIRVVCNGVVIESFADETSADLFRERNTRAARRIPRDLWRGVQRKLRLIDAASRLEDLAIPAGNRLERLKGDQAGRHSIRVNEQYRVTFRWEKGHAYEVLVEDYH
jgi:toxin HigB-1